jgi:hypothetical protein
MGSASGSLATTASDNVTHTGMLYHRVDVEALAAAILTLKTNPIPPSLLTPAPQSSGGTAHALAVPAGEQSVGVNAGAVVTGVDFGDFKLGTVSGTVYLDANGDGKLNNGESGQTGWTVTLHASNGSIPDQTFTTGSTGTFSFGNLAAGSYTLSETMLPNYHQTQPGAANTLKYTFTVTSQFAATDNFGNQLNPAAVVVVHAGDSTYNGQPYQASATVAGVVPGVDDTPSTSLEGVSLTVSYYVGSDTSGTLLGSPPTAAGTYTVVAFFPGSHDYLSASAQTTFKIKEAPLTITADSKTITYGDTLPSFTVSYGGLVPGDSPSVLGGNLSFSGTALTAVNAGNYSIVPAGLTAANYAITFLPGTLTIQQAPLTVTANSASKVYGSANPAFTVSYNGFIPGEGPGVLGGTLAFQTTATSASPVGNYTVTPAGLTSSNYAISFVPGQLQVTRAPLTITADDQTILAGKPLPLLTAHYNSFVNGDTPASLTSPPVLAATTVPAGNPPGNYPITVSGATSSNYVITFVNGMLHIRPLPSTVYVNASWANLQPGIDPDGAGPATEIGYDAFAAIGPAVNIVSPGGTVNVAVGTYAENVTVVKNLTLQGVGAGTVIMPPGGDGVTISTPATSVTVQNLRITHAVNAVNISTTGVTLGNDVLDASTTGVLLTGGSATLSGDTLTNDISGIQVTSGGRLTLGPNDSINAGTQGRHGLIVSGPTSQLAGWTLNNTAFSGFLGISGAWYAELRNNTGQGPQFIDATAAAFEGTAGAKLGVGALQNVENQIYDYHVDPGVGFFLLKKGVAFGGQNLTVIGTDNNDTINVNAANLANVSVSTTFGTFPATAQANFDVRHGRVIVFTLGGNKLVNINGAPDAEVHCGSGNDTVLGGMGKDILLGGPGNDLLVGRGTADVLVGGGGSDTLLAIGGKDILIAGSLNPGYNTYSYLDQVRTEWLASNPYAGAMLQALATVGVNHSDTGSGPCLLSHMGGPTAFIYRKTGTNAAKVYGLTAKDVDLGF